MTSSHSSDDTFEQGSPFLEGQVLDPLAFFSSSAAILYWTKPVADLQSEIFLDEIYSLTAPASSLLAESVQCRLGWHEEGIGLQLELGGEISSQSKVQFDLFIDTRDRKETAVLSRFCHHFRYIWQFASRGWEEVIGQEQTRLVGSEQRQLATAEQLKGAARARGARKTFRCWLPSVALYGYDPDLFNFTGLFWGLKIGASTRFFSLSRQEVGAESQPALWTSLRLERELD